MEKLIREVEDLLNVDNLDRNKILNVLSNILRKYNLLEDIKDDINTKFSIEHDKNKVLTEKVRKMNRIIDILLDNEYDD